MRTLFDRLIGSLVFKIAFAIIVVETILFGLFGGYYVNYFGAEIDRRIAEQISTPGRLIQQEQLKVSILSDAEQMELLLGRHLQQALAVGFDGTIYHSTDPLMIGASISSLPDFPTEQLRADMREQTLFTVDDDAGSSMVSITPIFALNANQPFMYVYLKVSTKGLEESQRQMQSVLVIGSILCVLLTSALIFLFTQHTVLKRLITAAQFVNKIQVGKLSSRLTPMGRDEIGILERGLNAMAESLERRTQQHQAAQNALRDSEERFRDFTLSSADWYWEMGSDFKIAFASYKFYQLIEEINGSPQGQSFDKLGLHPEHPEGWQYLQRHLDEHTAFYNVEFSWTSRDGEKQFGRINGVPVFALDGSFNGYRGTGSNITEQHRAAEEQQALQRQLATSQKLEAVGQMAGGVAHEFNNCLAGILSFAEVARAKIDDPERVKEYIDHVISLGERATGVADQLLMFSRRRIDQPKNVRVESIFAEMEKLLVTLLEHRIDLQIWADEADLHTRVDPTQLSACILNLAINARDAMPDGGTLQISCSSADIPPLAQRDADEDEDIYPPEVEGQFVVITVQDTGTGIPEDVIDHIFEPFFSTKEPGKGTGLGLSIVHSWVEEAHGFINLESVEGEGTTFSIYLPRSEPGAEPEDEVDEIGVFPGNGERVLIVDDEQALRTTAQIILEDAGYRTEIAKSTEEALVILQTSTGDAAFDVIVTDVVLPGRSGPQLIIEALRQNPRYGVVFMSGYPARSRKELDNLLGNYVFVKKPFRPGKLQKAVHDALKLASERAQSS
ncbi:MULTISPECIES: ATP-binding protein [unclassified Thalassospira]|uniref:ATP-binding protein n=1 Tax=unclassified Thalassospira TaxID=2648997 RepID=UPI0007A59FE5|nr:MULTISPECIES: ATP-binding protein [unclassified Thalassospira]KZC98873.1 hybrid sensor histidine kinase/response regulator [Thalassospira sp. MCCC 1A02898]ONH88841.1 histidine kinase [Thalassospira sp. MCCC 1A02803]